MISFFSGLKTQVQNFRNVTPKKAPKIVTDTEKRLKFIEDFNKKYDRKRVYGDNGAYAKYVIDKDTGRITQFFRKNEKGEKISGDFYYELNGRYKDTCMHMQNRDIHRETTFFPYGGRNVVTFDLKPNEDIISNVTTNAKGKITHKSELDAQIL